MLAGFFRLFSLRGRLARGPYAVEMIALAGAISLLWRSGAHDGVAGLLELLAFVLLPWLYIAALARRLVDCGRSRGWIFLPFVLALAAFVGGFWLYEASAATPGDDAWRKDALLVVLLPIIGSVVIWFLVRLAAGLTAAAAVWLVFTLALLIPASRTAREKDGPRALSREENAA